MEQITEDQIQYAKLVVSLDEGTTRWKEPKEFVCLPWINCGENVIGKN